MRSTWIVCFMSGPQILHVEWAFDNFRDANAYANHMNLSPEAPNYKVYCVPYFMNEVKNDD